MPLHFELRRIRFILIAAKCNAFFSVRIRFLYCTLIIFMRSPLCHSSPIIKGKKIKIDGEHECSLCIGECLTCKSDCSEVSTQLRGIVPLPNTSLKEDKAFCSFVRILLGLIFLSDHIFSYIRMINL